MVDVALVLFAIGGILAVSLAVILYRTLPCMLRGSHSHDDSVADDHGESDDESEENAAATATDGGDDGEDEEEEDFIATVTPPTPLHNPPEMSAFGWMMALGIAFVLLPLWPFIAIIWLVGKFGRSSRGNGNEHPSEQPPV